MQELPFLHSACRLMLIDICMEFRQDSLRGFQVTERTRFVTDRQTDGQTDAWGKTICLPTLKGGDIILNLIILCKLFTFYFTSDSFKDDEEPKSIKDKIKAFENEKKRIITPPIDSTPQGKIKKSEAFSALEGKQLFIGGMVCIPSNKIKTLIS